MLYLWLETLFNETFSRQMDGGNVEMGVVPSMGQIAFEQNMNIMRYEFPAIVYASVVQNYTIELIDEGPNCISFYNSDAFNLDLMLVNHICMTSGTFNETEHIDTLFKLVNIYMYKDTFLPELQAEFLNVTGKTWDELFGPSTLFGQLMTTKVIPDVYNFYKDDEFCTPSATQLVQECSTNQLAYGQWISGNITDRPMYNMEWHIMSTTSDPHRSYSRLYSNISQLSQPDFTPEVSYFQFKAGLDPIYIGNFTNILMNMDEDHLLN
jgi:hypothetical protein